MKTVKGFSALNVLITPDQKTALEEAARESEISVSALVRRILSKEFYRHTNSIKHGGKQR